MIVCYGGEIFYIRSASTYKIQIQIIYYRYVYIDLHSSSLNGKYTVFINILWQREQEILPSL